MNVRRHGLLPFPEGKKPRAKRIAAFPCFF
jgi:hypothetical protein